MTLSNYNNLSKIGKNVGLNIMSVQKKPHQDISLITNIIAIVIIIHTGYVNELDQSEN